MAVKRCYENIRRTFLEQQSEKKDFAEKQAKRRKYRSRRQRVSTYHHSYNLQYILNNRNSNGVPLLLQRVRWKDIGDI